MDSGQRARSLLDCGFRPWGLHKVYIGLGWVGGWVSGSAHRENVAQVLCRLFSMDIINTVDDVNRALPIIRNIPQFP